MHYHLQPGTSLFFFCLRFMLCLFFCCCFFLAVNLVGIQLTLNLIQLESVCFPHHTFSTTLKAEEFPPITRHIMVTVATVGVCVWWGVVGGLFWSSEPRQMHISLNPVTPKRVMRPNGFPQCQSAKSHQSFMKEVPFKFLFCSQHHL